MHTLRLILVFWLSIAVPLVASASLVNAGQCQRMQEKPMTAAMDHAQHAMHAMHAGHATGTMAKTFSDHQKKRADSGCTCGCDCVNQHCATGFSSLMGGLHASSQFFTGDEQRIARVHAGHPASAHPLDLLRPPTLS